MGQGGQRGLSENAALSPYSLFFEVEDTGAGIAPEELDELFTAFGQTETGRKSGEGTGLGLPISQKFVQLMGGLLLSVVIPLKDNVCF
jgi:signal transduction histidine kinase